MADKNIRPRGMRRTNPKQRRDRLCRRQRAALTELGVD